MVAQGIRPQGVPCKYFHGGIGRILSVSQSLAGKTSEVMVGMTKLRRHLQKNGMNFYPILKPFDRNDYKFNNSFGNIFSDKQRHYDIKGRDALFPNLRIAFFRKSQNVFQYFEYSLKDSKITTEKVIEFLRNSISWVKSLHTMVLHKRCKKSHNIEL